MDMKVTTRATYIKNVIVPSFILSGITGILTGAVIFFFKWGSEFFSDLSVKIYAAVCDKPAFIPLLFAGLALLAVIMAFFIKREPVVSGGGIPTAEGILRGLLTFKWLRTLIGMVVNSYIAFIAGLPLGNEGPSVLIGTSLGRGTNNLFNRNPAWDRYVMTGGAAAGFATVTGAPATGIIFALEEVHKRFSPMILMVALSSVVFASLTSEALAVIFQRNISMFSLSEFSALPIRDIWIGLAAGVVTGIVAFLFIKSFSFMYSLLGERIKAVPIEVKLIILFFIIGAVGLVLPAASGSGHAVIENVLDHNVLWYMLLTLLIVKIVTVVLCGGAGATGGLFVPILTVGALSGGILAEILVSCGVPASYYELIVTFCIASFLGATLRAPITAVLFFVEALGGFNNILFAVLGILVAFLIAEITGVKPLYEIVLERRLKSMYSGKYPEIINVDVVVKKGAFVIGKATRDIFWPPSCQVTAVVRAGANKVSDARMDKDGDKILKEGDTLSLRIQTYNREESEKLIADLVGRQDVAEQ